MNWKQYNKLKPKEQKEYDYRFEDKHNYGLGMIICILPIYNLFMVTMMFAIMTDDIIYKIFTYIYAIIFISFSFLYIYIREKIEAIKKEWLRNRGIK